jgi:hypothetical protein
MKVVLYKAKFKCGIDECPKREWEETRYKEFSEKYVTEEPLDSIFLPKTKTTLGISTAGGCSCPSPA